MQDPGQVVLGFRLDCDQGQKDERKRNERGRKREQTVFLKGSRAFGVSLPGEQRIRQFSEPVLEEISNRVDVHVFGKEDLLAFSFGTLRRECVVGQFLLMSKKV